MSLRVGLGASQADLDVQGEIDFDFFEESDNSIASASNSGDPTAAPALRNMGLPSGDSPDCNSDQNVAELCSSPNFHKPMITISCDDATGAVQKTTIETVIPTPYNYKENKCGKVSPSAFRKGMKKALSPHLQQKIFSDTNDPSDDSSISSMSESESDISSVSPDSFELNDESDSMTDVSPIASPYKCSTPADKETTDKLSPTEKLKEVKKEGVKFKDTENAPCEKCGSIDIRELVSAMKRLKMKQNTNLCALRCKSPIVTQNAKTRKNLSFSNEEVRRIDCDNQALLKRIMAQQNRASSNEGQNVQVRASSAVNRQKQQRQIEVENMAFLKRLEATKASCNVSRSQLLRDYDRRSSGLLSRASARSSYPGSTTSRSSCRSTTSQASSRSSVQSATSGVTRSQSSLSTVDKPSP